MQNHKKIFARKKDNVNFTQSTNLVNLKKKNMDMTLSGLNPTHFQGLVDGKQTGLYILVNKNGCELTLTNYGARIVSLMVPDKNGKMIDVVTGIITYRNTLHRRNLILERLVVDMPIVLQKENSRSMAFCMIN